MTVALLTVLAGTGLVKVESTQRIRTKKNKIFTTNAFYKARHQLFGAQYHTFVTGILDIIILH